MVLLDRRGGVLVQSQQIRLEVGGVKNWRREPEERVRAFSGLFKEGTILEVALRHLCLAPDLLGQLVWIADQDREVRAGGEQLLDQATSDVTGGCGDGDCHGFLPRVFLGLAQPSSDGQTAAPPKRQ